MGGLVLCSKVDPEIATLETYKCRLFVSSAANFANWLIQLGIHENKHERMPHSKMQKTFLEDVKSTEMK